MRIREFAQRMNMKVLTGDQGLDKEINGFYACDLLSWVMSHASQGEAWITVHTHLNIVAVAVLVETGCVIIPEGIAVEEATLKKAMEENVAILSTGMSAYEVCWRGHEILKNGELKMEN